MNASQNRGDVVNLRQSRRGAVSFTEKTRNNNVGAFPFLYSFIGYPYQYGAISNAGFYGNTVAEAEGPDGLLLTLGQLLRIPITMDRDANFHMLWMRYTVFNSTITNEAPGTALVSGSRSFLVGAQTSLQGGRTPYVASMNQHIPWNSFVDVSVYIRSIGGRDLYGGMAKGAQTGTYAEIPVPVTAMQTSADGVTTVRMPYLIPTDGVIMVNAINNTSPAGVDAAATLRIHGHIFGYKVPL